MCFADKRMATLTIKNFPDDLYATLKERAKLNRRSINSEAIICLERALRYEEPDLVETLAEIRDIRDSMKKVHSKKEKKSGRR